MINLEPFTQTDINRLIAWIKNEEDLIQFAGTYFSYPLTEEQLKNYIESENKIPFRIKDIESETIIGHCELNYSNPVPRLSRILIGEPEFRNKGLGKAIVNEMSRTIFESSSTNLIELIVFDWNMGAIRCYEKSGFYIREDWEDITLVKGQKWRALSMYLERNKWEQMLATSTND